MMSDPLVVQSIMEIPTLRNNSVVIGNPHTSRPPRNHASIIVIISPPQTLFRTLNCLTIPMPLHSALLGLVFSLGNEMRLCVFSLVCQVFGKQS